MKLKVLLQYAHEAIAVFPECKEEIRELYFMAKGEIEAGESEEHECELAKQSMRDCIVERYNPDEK
jgi:hypothetical protein